MIIRSLQYFFVVGLMSIVLGSDGRAEGLPVGKVHKLSFTDVDRNELSTADGHVSIIAVMTRPDADKARELGYRVPNEYKGNPTFRFITLINFQRSIAPVLRPVTEAVIRYQLDREAPRVQAIYAAKKISRDARRDLFVVADFDAGSITKLGIESASSAFIVFLFDRRGLLLRSWNTVPAAADLAEALREAG